VELDGVDLVSYCRLLYGAGLNQQGCNGVSLVPSFDETRGFWCS
jgi:hypothetical protein